MIDLRPQGRLQGVLPYRIHDHRYFRDYPYRRSLAPLFPAKDVGTSDVKAANMNGFIPPACTGSLCLDHGCGSGKFREFIKSFGYTYIGVDNESGTTTRQGGGEAFRGGADILCDLHRLPFADGTFRFSCSYSVFEHLQIHSWVRPSSSVSWKRAGSASLLSRRSYLFTWIRSYTIPTSGSSPRSPTPAVKKSRPPTGMPTKRSQPGRSAGRDGSRLPIGDAIHAAQRTARSWIGRRGSAKTPHDGRDHQGRPCQAGRDLNHDGSGIGTTRNLGGARTCR